MTTDPGSGATKDGRSGSGSELLGSGGSHATCAELRLNTLFSRITFAIVGK